MEAIRSCVAFGRTNCRLISATTTYGIYGICQQELCSYDRRIANDPLFPRCSAERESINHVFRSCDYANQIWTALGYRVHMQAGSMNFTEWLSWLFAAHTSMQKTEISNALWATWHARNRHARNRHAREGHKQGVGYLILFIRRYQQELLALELGNPRRHLASSVKWSPPPIGMAKINVDASYNENLKKSISGIVIRNESGEILGACIRFTHHVFSVCAAKAWSVLHGLHFAHDLGFLSVPLEGDSKTVFNKVNSQEDDWSEISAITWSIKELAQGFHVCRFGFIGRSGNNAAHEMAKKDWLYEGDRYRVEEAPNRVAAAVAKDRRLQEPP